MYVLSSPGGLSDEEQRPHPGGTWVWFLSEATALQEEEGVVLLPATEPYVAEEGQRRCFTEGWRPRAAPARHRGPRGGSPLPVDAGPQHPVRTQAGIQFQGPVSADSDIQQREMSDISQALAIL